MNDEFMKKLTNFAVYQFLYFYVNACSLSVPYEVFISGRTGDHGQLTNNRGFLRK